MENNKLMGVAAQYLESGVPIFYLEKQFTFTPGWFYEHVPENIWYNGGGYTVNWTYMPGCEQHRKSNYSYWSRFGGVICVGGYGVLVRLDLDLKPVSINVGVLQ